MKRAASAAVAVTLSLAPAAAWAQGSVEQAKTFFAAGAAAYEKGNFRAAIQAFEEAERLAPRPAIVFSMAQAHKRQYFAERRLEDLQRAIALYRRYLDEMKEGGRRADAAQALSELEPMAVRMAPGEASKEPPPPAKPQTRVMVTSPTKEAKASLDGAAPAELPLIGEVAPGKHKVKVFAEGYFDEERDLMAVEGTLVPSEIGLREKPARLAVLAPSGAQIAIDGRPQGETPLRAPLEVPPGRHFVSVTKSGSKAFAQEIELRRGEAKQLDASLSTTGQRVVSYVLLGVGATGLVLGVVAGGITLKEQNDAKTISDAREKGTISKAQLEEYNASVGARDDWRRTTGLAFGAGGVFALAGAILYAFDTPSVEAAPSRTEERPKKPETPSPEPSMEISLVPGLGGGAIVGRF